MKTVVRFLPESSTAAATRCPSARVKAASTRKASCSPVMRVAVLFLLPAGKSRSRRVNSRVLTLEAPWVQAWAGSGDRRGGGEPLVDVVGGCGADGEDGDPTAGDG